MKNIFIIFLLLSINIFAVDFGSILNSNNSQESNDIANDITMLLSKYNINMQNKKSNSSYNSIQKLLEKKDNSFFAIVKKDAITYFNKNNNSYKNIYNQIPAILSLGSEQIHIFTSENNDFDFDLKKEFNVYCGKKTSDSCITLEYIKNAYNFKFNYIKSNENSIFDDLKSNKIDLFVSVKKAPYKQYINLKGIKLIDLPTNFTMEDMYAHSQISSKDYSYIDDKIHSYSSIRVLITNLNQQEYKNNIDSILKIILLNQSYLKQNNKLYWENINFNNFNFKKFSISSKRTILKLLEQVKRENSLVF